jgi:hypothetical protein
MSRAGLEPLSQPSDAKVELALGGFVCSAIPICVGNSQKAEATLYSTCHLGQDINDMAHGAWRMAHGAWRMAHGKDSQMHAFWRSCDDAMHAFWRSCPCLNLSGYCYICVDGAVDMQSRVRGYSRRC